MEFDRSKIANTKHKVMLKAKNAVGDAYLVNAKDKFSITDIKKIGEIISKRHEGSKKLLNVTLQFSDGSQYSRTTRIYDNALYEDLVTEGWESVNVPTMHDGYDGDMPDETQFDKVVFKVISYKKVKGGASNKNDCLFFCISDAYAGKAYLPKPWNTATKVKKHLGITRNSKIEVDHLQEIADGMKCNFYLSGDDNTVYISKHKTNRNVHLSITDDHYKLLTTQPVFKKTRKLKSAKLMMVSDEMIKQGKKHNLYFCYLEKVGSFQKLALMNFRYFCKSIDYPEDITFNEFKYLELASLGDIYFCKSRNNKLESAYKVDVNSLYPHLLASLNSVYPMSQPNYERIEELPSKFCKFGLYQCEMSRGICDPELFAIIRKGKYKWYTHIDINDLRDIGCDFRLITGKMNYISYDTVVKGHMVFKPFVDAFYKAKCDKTNTLASQGFKSTLNMLWGTLCQKSLILKSKSKFDEYTNYPTLEQIPREKGDNIEFISKTKPYLNNWARIKPFLQAYSRRMMIKTIVKNDLYKSVHHIKVDSIISTEDPKVTISNELGEWKLEHKGKLEIIHTNRIVL